MRLKRPLDKIHVTWPFGATSDDPRLEGVIHQGTDFRAMRGTPTYAGAGAVATPHNQPDGFGRYMRLGLGVVTLDGWDGSHLHGDTVLYYAHLSIETTHRTLMPEEVIGWTGGTGFVTADHLHLELRVDGIPYDPMLYMEVAMGWEEDRVRALVTAQHVRYQIERAERIEEQVDQMAAEIEDDLGRHEEMRLQMAAMLKEARQIRQELIDLRKGKAYELEGILGGAVPGVFGQ